jgi:hypothetical protein
MSALNYPALAQSLSLTLAMQGLEDPPDVRAQKAAALIQQSMEAVDRAIRAECRAAPAPEAPVHDPVAILRNLPHHTLAALAKCAENLANRARIAEDAKAEYERAAQSRDSAVNSLRLLAEGAVRDAGGGVVVSPVAMTEAEPVEPEVPADIAADIAWSDAEAVEESGPEPWFARLRVAVLSYLKRGGQRSAEDIRDGIHRVTGAAYSRDAVNEAVCQLLHEGAILQEKPRYPGNDCTYSLRPDTTPPAVLRQIVDTRPAPTGAFVASDINAPPVVGASLTTRFQAVTQP